MKKCKECLVEKPMDDFYSHPLTKDRRLPKCKDCIKAGRSTENELIMARIRDKERYQSQKIKHKARQWTYMSSQKNKHLIPIICPITGGEVVELHHVDYKRPLWVLPCSREGHIMLHKGLVLFNEEWMITLPDIRNESTKIKYQWMYE